MRASLPLPMMPLTRQGLFRIWMVLAHVGALLVGVLFVDDHFVLGLEGPALQEGEASAHFGELFQVDAGGAQRDVLDRLVTTPMAILTCGCRANQSTILLVMPPLN